MSRFELAFNFKRKISKIWLSMLLTVLPTVGFSKTLCTMTFNSNNEKRVFSQNLSPLGYKTVELVPSESKDPKWLDLACTSQIKCDILLVSGHFGGLFFGEKISPTLEIERLAKLREQRSCDNILNAKAVYLMGCNTMASKLKDHRSIDDYLRVLVKDGFPLNLAEEVAAARYLNFGRSMSEKMTKVFSHSQLLIGFDSTGPLGKQAEPRLKKAFQLTDKFNKFETGLSEASLKKSFAGTNMRIVNPQKSVSHEALAEAMALSPQQNEATAGWMSILSNVQSVKRYSDFILRHGHHTAASALIRKDAIIKSNILTGFNEIYLSSKGLMAIQKRILSFFKTHQMITNEKQLVTLAHLLNQSLIHPIDYVLADQVCEVLTENPQVYNMLAVKSRQQIHQSQYSQFLKLCARESLPMTSSPVLKCLSGQDGANRHPWSCLTENPSILDINACLYAKNNNQDMANGDDMLFYCFDNLLYSANFKKSDCLQLTHGFSILGNRIKMNWNCINRVP